jgi:hypothetical protein
MCALKLQVGCLVPTTTVTKSQSLTEMHNRFFVYFVIFVVQSKTSYTGREQLFSLMKDGPALFIHPLFQFFAHFKIGKPFTVHPYKFPRLRVSSRIG